MKTTLLSRIALCAGLAALLSGALPALAQVAPSLGSESTFGIVSSTFTNTAAGTTVVGDVCFTTGPAVPATVSGTTGPCPAAAGTDQSGALAILNGQACTPLPAGPLEAVIIGTNPPGVIPPGCYFRSGAIDITANGLVTLNGNGVYIFRSTGGAITTGANSTVALAGGACAGNVFWAPAGATTLGATSRFVGNILDAAGVSIGLGAALSGRALAFGGTVTTDAAAITVPAACAAATVPTVILTKISNGGVGSFSFTGTNGVAAQTITTVSSGTGVSGLTQALTAAGVVTTITEGVPPTGFALASITCSGLGAGGTAVASVATRTVTLDALATAAGSAISCTFTNTFTVAPPPPPPGAAPAVPVPTLSEWAMILLASLLAMAGFAAIRRGRR